MKMLRPVILLGLSFIWLPVIFLLVPPFLALAQPEAHLRVCLAVEDYAEGTSEPPKTEVFTENSKPGPDKQLSLYAEATRDGFLLMAAFNPSLGGLAHGWRPQIELVHAGEEFQIPFSPMVWWWTDSSDAFEVIVLFLEHSSEAEELQELILAMQDAEADSEILDLQSKKLESDLHRLMATEDASTFHAGTVPNQWGGTLRGLSFPWRSHALKIPLQDSRAFQTYHYEP